VDSDVDRADKHNVHRLLACQDEWKGFAVDMLARPLIPDSTGQNRSTADHSDIVTYGSIVSLRDVQSHVCSEPMLICRVEKGIADISDTTGKERDAPVQFQIVGTDTMAVREVLAWARSRKVSLPESDAGKISAASKERKESYREATASADLPTAGGGSFHERNEKSSLNRSGGAISPMQKVALVQIFPRLHTFSGKSNFFDCDLASPRSYLCSTVLDGASDTHTSVALFRTRKQLQSRLQAIEDGVEIVEDSDNAPDTLESRNRFRDTSSHPVKYVHPPSESLTDGSSLIDALKDAFCWTIVTTGEWQDTVRGRT